MFNILKFDGERIDLIMYNARAIPWYVIIDLLITKVCTCGIYMVYDADLTRPMLGETDPRQRHAKVQ